MSRTFYGDNVPLLGAGPENPQNTPDPAEQRGPFVRVLVCFTCKTQEVLADYPPTTPPEHDAVLHEIDFKHGGAETDPTRMHERQLFRPEQETWDNPRIRRQLVKQIWSGRTGFVPEYYHVRDTLKEDAAKCWRAHGKPDARVGCSDYRSDSKRIGNPAAQDRKLLAKEMHRDARDFGPGPKVTLCQFCPYETVVQQKKQDLYGDGYGN